MTKHTPGPWVARAGKGAIWRAAVDGPTGDPVCVVHDYDGTDHAANAHLIAAAPDLMAACEAFVEAEHAAILDGQRAFSMYVDAIDEAKAAIAKAMGEKP